MVAEDLSFVFASGFGQIGRQSITLLRSINRHHPDAPIYVYLPDSEHSRLDSDVSRELEQAATVLHGPIPIDEYPISTKIAALGAAEAAAETEYLLMLDTDTVVLDRIDIHEQYEADLYLKPVDIGRQFWGRERSVKRWRDLYDRYDIEVPDWRVRSTFDDIEMLPYWNAGFVLESLKHGGIGDEWLRYTSDLHGEIPYDRHADQVALGLVSAAEGREIEQVSNQYNYPLHLRLRCPADTKILHYHNERELRLVRDDAILEELAAVGFDIQTDWLSIAQAWFILDRVQRWVRRKTLPIDETHTLERIYLKLKSVTDPGRSE